MKKAAKVVSSIIIALLTTLVSLTVAHADIPAPGGITDPRVLLTWGPVIATILCICIVAVIVVAVLVLLKMSKKGKKK